MNTHHYRCGVANCGNGQCIHKLLDTKCPYCGSGMVQVATTGHEFCSNHTALCDYEVEVKEYSL